MLRVCGFPHDFKRAASVFDLAAHWTGWVFFLPLFDTLIAVGMEAGQDCFNLAIDTNATNVQLWVTNVILVLIILLDLFLNNLRLLSIFHLFFRWGACRRLTLMSIQLSNLGGEWINIWKNLVEAPYLLNKGFNRCELAYVNHFFFFSLFFLFLIKICYTHLFLIFSRVLDQNSCLPFEPLLLYLLR